MQTTTIPLDRLQPYPGNANLMGDDLLKKLTAHIQRTGRYPPLIVRPLPQDQYQILDGHHRAAALRALGHDAASCVVWQVDDDEALLLLTTLNRLQGQDDPHRRAALVSQLAAKATLQAIAGQLPENLAALNEMIQLSQPPPNIQPPPDLTNMPLAVHFFLLPHQKRLLDQRLALLGGKREDALMRLLRLAADQT